MTTITKQKIITIHHAAKNRKKRFPPFTSAHKLTTVTKIFLLREVSSWRLLYDSILVVVFRGSSIEEGAVYCYYLVSWKQLYTTSTIVPRPRWCDRVGINSTHYVLLYQAR